MSTQAHQDYLRAVYSLLETSDWVTTSVLAEHLGVRPSSVTSMVKKLSGTRPRLLDYKSHRGVALTKAGRRIALEMTRRHRLIEQFLVAMMGFRWDEVHEEAHRLEHSVSDVFIDRLDELLGRPTRDPHGRPIPSKSGDVPSVKEIQLSKVTVNEQVTVSSVGSEETKFLKYLTDIGLIPSAVVWVTGANPTGGTLDIEIAADQARQRHVIGSALAEKIFVLEPT